MNATAIAKNLEICKARAAFWEAAAKLLASLPPEAEVHIGDEWVYYITADQPRRYLTFPDAAEPLRKARLAEMRAASER